MRNLIKANQAGQNFCPFYLSEAHNCEGMRCMAWRWDENDIRLGYLAENKLARTIEEAGDRPSQITEYWEFSPYSDKGYYAEWREPLITKKGYCGRINHE